MALRFDASTDRAETAATLSSSSACTVAGWFRVDTARTVAYSTFFHINTEDIWVGTWTDGTTLAVYAPTSERLGSNPGAGVWFHLAWAGTLSDSSAYTLYLNGASDISSSTETPVAGGILTLGNDQYGEWLNGRAAAVKVWTRILTQAEIQNEMRSVVPVDPRNLWAYYPTIGANVTAAYRDYSGNGRNFSTGAGTPTVEDGPPVGWQRRRSGIFVQAGGAAYNLDVDSGSYALTGTAAGLEHGYAISAGAASYGWTGTAAGAEYGRVAGAAAGSYALTGTDAALQDGRVVAVDAGSYALTGSNAGTEYGRVFASDAGSYGWTGTDASLELGRAVSAEAASYAETGTAASLEYDRVFSSEAGSYALSGAAAGLERGYALVAEAASYGWTGTAAAGEYGRVVSSAAGSYALSGTDASLEYAAGRELVAEAASYGWAGDTVAVTKDHQIVPEAAAFALTGATVGLADGRALAVDAGSYAWSGDDCGLFRDGQAIPGVGAYTASGATAGLSYSEEVSSRRYVKCCVGVRVGL